MRILIGEDEVTTRMTLKALLSKWGYDVLLADTGTKAWEILEEPSSPDLILLDWVMPGMDGVDICRWIRENESEENKYIIMLTTKAHSQDVIEGLNAGANDYVVKPFDKGVLQARINIGRRYVDLRHKLDDRYQQLQAALDQIQTLEGIIPICSYCKNIRDDDNYWQNVERYIGEHSKARFSHGICPDCYEKYVVPQLNEKSEN